MRYALICKGAKMLLAQLAWEKRFLGFNVLYGINVMVSNAR
jgi:hypothetical protein